MNSKRLKLLSDVFVGDVAYDIGSDHGYLIKDLLERGKIIRAHVVEVNKLPLENAKRNLKSFKNVHFHLSDGMVDVEVDSTCNNGFIIAGMGGLLISQIIEDSIDKFFSGVLYLQPNNKEYELREFLNNNNFEILTEYVTIDKEKSYFVIVAQKGNQELNDIELVCGKNAVINEDYILTLRENLKYLSSVMSSLEKNKIDNTELKRKYYIIEQVLGEIDEN